MLNFQLTVGIERLTVENQAMGSDRQPFDRNRPEEIRHITLK